MSKTKTKRKQSDPELSGQRFGHLVALRRADHKKGRAILWMCRCDCGRIVCVSASILYRNKRRACGQCRFPAVKASNRNLTGQRFGHLVALRPTDDRKSGSVVWMCRCDCGRIVYASSGILHRKSQKSCGRCRHSEKGKSLKNLIGHRIGHLFVLCLIPDKISTARIWKCRCDCGRIVEVPENVLLSRQKKSCGKCRHAAFSAPMRNIAGERFGHLVALRPTKDRKGGSVVWICRCDCGRIIRVSVGHLRSKNKKSCGQCRFTERKQPIRNVAGQRFGHLVALRPTDDRKGGFVVWMCRCDCGRIAYVPIGSLHSKNTKSCGRCGRHSVSHPKPKKETFVYTEKNMKGHRFGMLTAIQVWHYVIPDQVSFDENRGKMIGVIPYWQFQCDCGNDAVLNAYSVMNGEVVSCGCVKKEPLPPEILQSENITGQRYNKLVAIRFDHKDKNGNACWLFQCDCGNTKVIPAVQVKRGNTKSCGCLKHAPRPGISKAERLKKERKCL